MNQTTIADLEAAVRARTEELEAANRALQNEIEVRKRTEEALRESARQFEFLAKASPSIVFRTDAEGRATFVSDQWSKISGVPAKNWTESVCKSLVHPDEQEAVLEDWLLAVQAGRAWKREIRVADRSGETRWMYLVTVPIRDEQGCLTGYVGTATDITDVKESALALGASEERYRTLVQSASYCIHEVNREGELIAVNRAGLTMLEVEREEEVLGLSYVSLVHEDDREDLARSIEAAFAGEASFFEVHRGDGEERRTFRSSLVPILDQQGGISRVMGQSEEITEMRRAEAKRRQLLEQLRHSQKLEAVGTLAAGVAHEFNNMLQVILGYSSLVQELTSNEGEVARSISEIQAAARQAVEVTKALLTFSGRVNAQKETIDLGSLADECIKLLRPTLPASFELELVQSSAGPSWVHGDASQFSQVLLNLAVNARDAMPEGGRIEVALLHDRRGSDGSVIVEVRDQGHGMTEEVKAQIFDPFFTTKPREQGTGLGLAVVHGIVSDHGGEIEVDTRVGGGTTFRILLPARQPEVDPPKSHQNRGEDEVQGGGQHVLVVDDEPHVRSVVCAILVSAGYRVAEAADGVEGMERFLSEDGFDLIIVDEDMPRMRGSECLANLRAKGLQFPAILMSGMRQLGPVVSDDGTLQLKKPFELGHFLEAVRTALSLASISSQSS